MNAQPLKTVSLQPLSGFVPAALAPTLASIAMASKAPWYLIQVRAQFEAKVSDELTGQGFDHYLPRQTVHGQRVGRGKERVSRHRPLFPGYLFVRVDYPRQAFGSVTAILGVVRFMGVTGPVIVPGTIVAGIREAEQAGLFEHGPKAPRAHKKGDRVRIIGTAFHGHFAEVMQERSSKGRVRVAYQCFGRMVEQDFKPEALEPVA
jgi:transcriptional antiterminator RfaH